MNKDSLFMSFLSLALTLADTTIKENIRRSGVNLYERY